MRPEAVLGMVLATAFRPSSAKLRNVLISYLVRCERRSDRVVIELRHTTRERRRSDIDEFLDAITLKKFDELWNCSCRMSDREKAHSVLRICIWWRRRAPHPRVSPNRQGCLPKGSDFYCAYHPSGCPWPARRRQCHAALIQAHVFVLFWVDGRLFANFLSGFFLAVRLSAVTHSLATFCGMPAFSANAELCAAASIKRCCWADFDSIDASM